MAQWVKAGDVPELAALFANVPAAGAAQPK